MLSFANAADNASHVTPFCTPLELDTGAGHVDINDANVTAICFPPYKNIAGRMLEHHTRLVLLERSFHQSAM